MLTLINGVNGNQVSVFDRGLMYGQSIFETIAVSNGRPCLINEHLERLTSSAKVFGLQVDSALIAEEVAHLTQSLSRGVIRITLTMGPGGRGYQTPQTPSPTRIISQHEYPDYPHGNWLKGIEIGLVDIRLAQQPALAGLKHGNRLEQIIARSQWHEHWQEALVRDVDGNVIEGTQSNVFLVKDGSLVTPALDSAGVNGVMRQSIIALAKKSGINVTVKAVSVDDIKQADAVFMTNCVIGLWPVTRFEEISYNKSTIANNLLKEIIKNEFIPNF